MDRVSAFLMGNAIGLTVLFAGILISAPKKIKETEAIQKIELQRTPQKSAKEQSTKDAQEPGGAHDQGTVDPKSDRLANGALNKSANLQRSANNATADAPDIVAARDIVQGEQLDAQNIAVPTASGIDKKSRILQTLYGKAAKIHIRKGAKIEAQYLEND